MNQKSSMDSTDGTELRQLGPGKSAMGMGLMPAYSGQESTGDP
ncbi:hypothetical protein [uncultured Ruegeria sp.]|nr:hypothetical protein [uncultured Ruegeria sp.]